MWIVADEVSWTAAGRLRELAQGTRQVAERRAAREERAELLRIAERLEAVVAEMESRPA